MTTIIHASRTANAIASRATLANIGKDERITPHSGEVRRANVKRCDTFAKDGDSNQDST